MTSIAIAPRTTIPTVDLQVQLPELTAENPLKAALEHACRVEVAIGALEHKPWLFTMSQLKICAAIAQKT
jgi:hypothetical protein